MYSAEVLSQLRSLNWLALEIHRVPSGSPECAHLQSQMEAVRARLPTSILDYHDRVAKTGKLSATEVTGEACGGCHSKIPPDLLIELKNPGRFGVCPNCGLFLWVGGPATTQAESETRSHEANTANS